MLGTHIYTMYLVLSHQCFEPQQWFVVGPQILIERNTHKSWQDFQIEGMSSILILY